LDEQQGTTELQAALQGAVTNGTSSTFENALNIKLFKTVVSVVYPLNYYRVRKTSIFSVPVKVWEIDTFFSLSTQTVNGKPKEIVYQVRSYL
jgi:hypothetical protein